MTKTEFIKQCKEKRKYFDFSLKDMSNCLIGVSENDYNDFENGKCKMTKENLERIVRVLHIEENQKFHVENYIEIDGLTNSEIDDLSKVVASIVGEQDA